MFKLAEILVLSLLLLPGTAEAKTNTSDASNSAIGTGIPEPISLAGSRYVWVEGMGPILNLTPLNSDIFYYDIDSGAGGEIMNIDIGDPSKRTIQLDKLAYYTSAFNISFKYRRFGNHSAIGFLGKKYLAAYTNDSKIASKPVNLLSRKILSKILIDENKNHSLTEGKNFTLGAGYVLRIRDVNITSKTAVISINKNEIEFYRRVVNPGYIAVYEKAVDKVYSVYDNQKYVQKDFPDFLPVIAIHVDSIRTEDGNATVVIDGIFQLSDVYTDIDPEYSLLGITEISETGIAMKNRMKAGLSISDNMNFVNAEGTYISPIYLINNIRFKFTKSKELRFLAYDANIPVNHERRGSVYSGASAVQVWDGLNFPGFWYDIDSNSFSEKLEITNISGRKIPKGYLRYDIAGVNIPLKVAGINGSELYGLNTSFMVFGIGAEKYIAANKSTELSKILIEHTDSPYDKKLFAQGDVWELGEGYNLTLKTLEVRVDPRRALLSFSHDGAVLKESWVRSGGIFSYSENASSGQIKAPKFFTYVDAIFTGCCFDFAQLRYTFLISDNITRIHKGDRIGAFRVIGVEPDFISMENDIDIYLRPGSRPNLIGNLSFRVADADELRFYPSNTRGQEISEEIEEVQKVENPANQSANISGTQPGYNESRKVAGFEAVLVIAMLLAVYLAGWKRR
ncbi:MAG TPA: S-layer protein domain-containing protein [Candidatus Methanoperedens sp.]